jgi:hypothetical protein
MSNSILHPRSAARLLAWALPLAAVACQSTPEEQSLARREVLGSPAITHLVLVQLKDPSRLAELVADCDRVLPAIEGVAGYSCGVPLDMGRSNVSGDYDVGIYVGFRDADAYRSYVDDPRHLELVERWRDGWKGVRIFDVIEGIPAVAPPAPAPSAAPVPAPAAPSTAVPATPAATPAAPTPPAQR